MRVAKKERRTKETDIKLTINLDGSGKANIDTGIGFLDHMLNSFARHGFFDLDLSCQGDLHVDGHHTAEDIGIVLGEALKEAIGDKVGIKRYGSMMLPMDDALVMCAIDFCGRPYLNYDISFPTEKIGYLETEVIKEFFYALSYSAGMNIHLVKLNGDNSHHIAEAAFKAYAYALAEAVKINPDIKEVLSTKGSLS